jgi:hypothetical protein
VTILDDFAPDWNNETLVLAELAGARGITADDIRDWAIRNEFPVPANPGSFLGGLAARNRLRVVGEEPSRVRSSKGRRVRRFVLVEG